MRWVMIWGFFRGHKTATTVANILYHRQPCNPAPEFSLNSTTWDRANNTKHERRTDVLARDDFGIHDALCTR